MPDVSLPVNKVSRDMSYQDGGVFMFKNLLTLNALCALHQRDKLIDKLF